MSIYLFKFLLLLSVLFVLTTAITKVANNVVLQSKIKNVLADPIPTNGFKRAPFLSNTKLRAVKVLPGEGTGDVMEPIGVSPGIDAAKHQYPDANEP